MWTQEFQWGEQLGSCCISPGESFNDFLKLIYFWLQWVFVAVRGLLIAVASLVAEHGALECRLGSCGARAQ